MNTLRNYLLVFTMALMSVCFVACGNNTTTDNETTTATNQESSSENTTKGGNSGKVDNKNDGVIGDIGDDGQAAGPDRPGPRRHGEADAEAEPPEGTCPGDGGLQAPQGPGPFQTAGALVPGQELHHLSQ